MIQELTAGQEAAIPGTVRWNCVCCGHAVIRHDDRMRARCGTTDFSRRMLYCLNCGDTTIFSTTEVKDHG